MNMHSTIAPKAPRTADVHVGQMIRRRRKQIGISQEKLGKALGITFQQVQQYEKGTNRVAASRLVEIARVLDVPVAFFFPEGASAAAMPEAFDAGAIIAALTKARDAIDAQITALKKLT